MKKIILILLIIIATTSIIFGVSFSFNQNEVANAEITAIEIGIDYTFYSNTEITQAPVIVSAARYFENSNGFGDITILSIPYQYTVHRIAISDFSNSNNWIRLYESQNSSGNYFEISYTNRTAPFKFRYIDTVGDDSIDYGVNIDEEVIINFSSTSYTNTNGTWQNWSDLLDFICNFLGVYSDQSYINGYNDGYAAGMIQGYNDGYADGAEDQINNNIISDNTTGVIKAIFDGLFGQIFAVEIFPNFPLYLFILIPTVFAVIGLLLWLVRGK